MRKVCCLTALAVLCGCQSNPAPRILPSSSTTETWTYVGKLESIQVTEGHRGFSNQFPHTHITTSQGEFDIRRAIEGWHNAEPVYASSDGESIKIGETVFRPLTYEDLE